MQETEIKGIVRTSVALINTDTGALASYKKQKQRDRLLNNMEKQIAILTERLTAAEQKIMNLENRNISG